MFDKILVPLDGSVLAEQVLPYARFIAARLSLPVELLKIVDAGPPEMAQSRYAYEGNRRLRILNLQSGEYLGKVARALENGGLTVGQKVREGHPAEVIVEQARECPNALIVMSTHGWSGVVRWFLGSVTDKVLHATTSPLLIVRAHLPNGRNGNLRLQSVLVPLDGSALAEEVLPLVALLARALGLRIILIRATPSTGEYHRYMEYISTSYGDLSSGVNEQAVEYLHQVGQELRRQGVTDVQERVLHGHPAVAIVDFARALPDNLIVMASHGRSGVGYWLLGSVTDLVVRHSGDLILVVRATPAPLPECQPVSEPVSEPVPSAENQNKG